VPNPAPARAEQQAEVPARPVPQRASTPGETPVDATTARPQDSAAIAKTGAELAQSLGFTAPAQHGAPMQSTAAAHAAAAAAPAPAPTPAVPIANVAFEIAAQSLAGKNRFEIRLDPPELGRIDVRLEIDQDGHVKSRLIVERAETLDMLRRDAPQLERALQQAGLKTSDNALEFSLRDQAQHRDDDQGNGNAHRLAVADDGLPAADTIQHNYGRLLGLGSGLDIRV
jgi:flagellar hook-length control protein FliK